LSNYAIIKNKKEACMKASGPGNKYYRVCIFLNEEEKEKLFLAMYKERTTPAKFLRKALMSYIEKSLCNGVNETKEDNEPIIL
jgi:hypothetical protein